jgi:hypothetical protein
MSLLSPKISKDPASDYLKLYAKADSNEMKDTPSRVISKIVYDFDNDGIHDVAITNSHNWGAHIGPWDIYIGQKNGNYKYIGSMDFVNDAVRVIPIKKGLSKIISYSHWSVNQGELIEYQLSSNRIKEIKRIMIYPDYYSRNKDWNKYEELFNNHALPDSTISISDYRKKGAIWK